MDIYKPDNPVTLPAATQAEPAGFWIRLSAFIIDFLCVWFPSFLLTIKLGNGMDSVFVVFFIPFSYHTLAIGRWGQTFGKFLAGILVVRKSGEQIGYLRALGRTSVWYLVTISLFFGLTVFLTSGNSSPFTVLMLGILCFLGTVLNHKIFAYDLIWGTKVIYKEPIGRLRKTVVILFGTAALLLVSYKCLYPPSSHPERPRAAEAADCISAVKSAQERHLSKYKVYADQFTKLDITYGRMTANEISLNFFVVSISTSGCGKQPCYVVTAKRHLNNATVAHRYGLYSLNAIIPDRPEVQIASCPGGGTNCEEILN